MVRKYITLFLFLFVGTFAHAQVINQTFIDRCTGEVKVVTANFSNGPTAVSFYNKVRVFTPQEAVNGTLQQWLIQTYTAWNALSPCSQTAQQAQQAQQTAQQATQAAQQATTNIPVPPPSTNTTSTSNATNSNSNTSGGSNNSEVKTNSESTETNSSSSESESTSTEKSGDEKSDEDSKSAEGEDSEDGDDDKKSDKKDKKQQRLNPILVSGDVIAMQSLTGRYNGVVTFGLSQSSIFGDVSYSANTMIWDNLKQIVLGGSVTKTHMNENYGVDYIDSYSINYARMYKSNSVAISNSTIKPTKVGTFGFGVNANVMWGSDMEGVLISYGWNILYTHSFPINKYWTYSPALIMAKNPGTLMSSDNSFITNKDGIGIISNGFDLQISKRFRINLNYTLIGSDNPSFPFMHNFMVGSKLQF